MILFLIFLVLSSYTNYTFNGLNPTQSPSFQPTAAADDASSHPISPYDSNPTRGAITLVLLELVIVVFFVICWIWTRCAKIYCTVTFFTNIRSCNSSTSHLTSLRLLKYTGLSDFSIWREFCWASWFSLTIYGDILRLRHRQETDKSTYTIAVATMLQYFIAVTFLRPFPVFGPLIGMIEAICWDTKWYILIIAIVLFGFSQAIYLSSWSDIGNVFGDPADSLVQSIVYFVGNPVFPPTGTYGEDGSVATFLSVMLTIVGSVIMLNLLVAIMNDSYSRISRRIKSEWVKQICITINGQTPVSLRRVFGQNLEGDLFIHYLRRKLDVEDSSKKSS